MCVQGSTLHGSDPHERIALIRQGIPASTISRLSARMGMSKELLLSSLGLSRATISRKEKDAGLLSKDESERVRTGGRRNSKGVPVYCFSMFLCSSRMSSV